MSTAAPATDPVDADDQVPHPDVPTIALALIDAGLLMRSSECVPAGLYVEYRDFVRRVLLAMAGGED